MSAAEVRRLLGPNMILGVSTKSCAEVRSQLYVLFTAPLVCMSQLIDMVLFLGPESTGGWGGLRGHRGRVPHQHQGADRAAVHCTDTITTP